MSRLTQLDIPDRAARYVPTIVSQLIFAGVCTVAAIALRAVTDMILPSAGPFALTFPAVLIATLFGRWQAGVVTQAVSSLYAWYFVLPIVGSFKFAVASDAPRVAVNLVAGFAVVALAELFRRAVRRALSERELLLLELEHRVKNNFASMASILRLQMKETTDDATKMALQTALGRIDSYSRAHSFLYRDFDQTGTVNMQFYLDDLCRALSESLGGGLIRFDCDAAPIHMPRERAITLGLLVNEVATNSAKHAFRPGSEGSIHVVLADDPDAYHLRVSDNGEGMRRNEDPSSLGLKLIEALAAQANGNVQTESGATGTSYRFEFAR